MIFRVKYHVLFSHNPLSSYWEGLGGCPWLTGPLSIPPPVTVRELVALARATGGGRRLGDSLSGGRVLAQLRGGPRGSAGGSESDAQASVRPR